MKHKAFTLVEFIVVVVIIGILAAILFPVFSRSRDSDGHPSCQSHLKPIGLGVLQYVQDYDEKYPPAQSAAGGWVTLIFPYVKSDQLFQCPNDKSGATLETTDYFYNARLAGVEINKLGDTTLTILAGDGQSNQNASAHLLALPDSWRKDESSPAWRHLDGANYAFADGHVKWFKPGKITLQKTGKNTPTFLLQ